MARSKWPFLTILVVFTSLFSGGCFVTSQSEMLKPKKHPKVPLRTKSSILHVKPQGEEESMPTSFVIYNHVLKARLFMKDSIPHLAPPGPKGPPLFTESGELTPLFLDVFKGRVDKFRTKMPGGEVVETHASVHKIILTVDTDVPPEVVDKFIKLVEKEGITVELTKSSSKSSK